MYIAIDYDRLGDPRIRVASQSPEEKEQLKKFSATLATLRESKKIANYNLEDWSGNIDIQMPLVRG